MTDFQKNKDLVFEQVAHETQAAKFALLSSQRANPASTLQGWSFMAISGTRQETNGL